MDWKKLDTDLRAFAASHNLECEELNTRYLKGQLTTYRMAGKPDTFYEIRHAKPVSDYGSKLRIYSRVDHDISIECRTGWLGKQNLSMNKGLTAELNMLITELAELIETFTWSTKVINPEWPEVWRNTKCLEFESSKIDLAVAELERIAHIHQMLSK